MNYTLWDALKGEYAKLNGLTEEVVELLSVRHILLLCAEGLSTRRISGRLGLSQKYIADILLDYFDFAGWADDLDFSPIALYKQANGDLGYYSYLVFTLPSVVVREAVMSQSYLICSKMQEIKELLKKYDY